jgi:hypothetical protein
MGSLLEVRLSCLKGHGNEADFLGFLHKLNPHRSLTLPFEPFRFWLRIRGVDKTAYRYNFFKHLNKSMVIVNYISGLFFAKLVFGRASLAA